MKREQAIPLSDQVLDILCVQHEVRDDRNPFVFPGRPMRSLSDMTLAIGYGGGNVFRRHNASVQNPRPSPECPPSSGFFMTRKPAASRSLTNGDWQAPGFLVQARWAMVLGGAAGTRGQCSPAVKKTSNV